MKRKSIKEAIKEHFFTHPSAQLRVRQIERELKLSLPSVIASAHELKKEGMLKEVKMGNVVFYAADRASKEFLLEKKLFNIKMLYASGLIDFLVDKLSNPTILIFGSYAKGEDIERSDIDLYIETPSKKEVNLEKFEKILQRKIQIFKHSSIHSISNKHLVNNIFNGMILNGFIEVLK